MFSSGSWVILSPIEKQIKEKIERIGTPLKNWDIRINYGIKTGFNEAFIVDGEKRKKLIEQDPKSEEIIRPILRGRDIKRYSYDFADFWLINTHNGVKEKGVNRINIEDYPAIKQHLDQYYSQLEKRADKGDTPYNLRNCAYTEDFYKQKIVYNDIAQKLTFSLAEKGMFFNNTVYFINGNEEELKYLIGFLNSSLIDWYYKTLSVQLGEKAVRLFSIYVEKIPIVKYCHENGIIQLVDYILSDIDNSQEIEVKLNKLIYRLYDLTNEEIEFIEAR